MHQLNKIVYQKSGGGCWGGFMSGTIFIVICRQKKKFVLKYHIKVKEIYYSLDTLTI